MKSFLILASVVLWTLTASGQTIRINWTPSPAEDEVSGYRIWQSDDAIYPQFRPLAIVAGPPVFFLDAAPGTNWFRISALSSGGESHPSEMIVVTAALLKVSPPVGLTAVIMPHLDTISAGRLDEIDPAMLPTRPVVSSPRQVVSSPPSPPPLPTINVPPNMRVLGAVGTQLRDRMLDADAKWKAAQQAEISARREFQDAIREFERNAER